MNKLYKDPLYQDVCPYLILESVETSIDFLKKAFRAELIEEMKDKEGRIRHAEVRIGDSVIMMGPAGETSSPTNSMFYVHVADTDTVYRACIDAGASDVQEPEDQFYGHRTAAVNGPDGNQWWIATKVEKISPEELQKRAREL